MTCVYTSRLMDGFECPMRTASSRAEVGGGLLTAVALADLCGFDRWVELEACTRDTSPDRAAADEAHDINDLALRGQALTLELVEVVDGLRRIRRDKRDGVGGLGHT